ncbi:MAG: hypothetical protein H0W74_05370 [Sphingosinicella sp.]|nr:hypothetical protein [Sphingosinicella sp.]
MTTPASTQGRENMAALAQLQAGRWELRELNNRRPQPPRSICISDPAIMLQIQHHDRPCSRLVIASDANSATVHYTCTAGGFGRTTLKVSTPRLVRIETQGIDRELPFDFSAELRRKGGC